MKTVYDIIGKPLVTEKSSQQSEKEQTYAFHVDPLANKPQIKEAVEKIFKVKVADVRTVWMKGKPRRYRFKVGHRSNWKKAYVTLKEGQRIDVI